MTIMPHRLRLLPVLMGSATVLLGLKCFDIAGDVGDLVSPAQAATAQLMASIEPAAGDAKAGNAGAGAATASGLEPLPSSSFSAEAASRLETGGTPDASSMSRSEIELLQELAQRRAELKQRETQLDMRERLLQATEQKIDGKISKLKEIQAQLKVTADAQDAKQEVQLKSLVKVYENMKPGDAARILEKLDLKILMQVVQRMSERKVAPVMAAMSPESAKLVTTELATRKELPSIDPGS